ncbi:hypothetical protein [Curtobacterium sp. MCBD17_021]|uniref:hypothetical protein n=1 Tax=Curtobacterium sp. MCBD17_021 TaxID=2175665 RepID=UPI000DA8AAEA|nr:hypothetical protein [Curtobacterium sp. MCBD17_021]PZE64556.1 hypothetical protein DEI83_11735 [Curtobacterium sp. MCBD17_021]
MAVLTVSGCDGNATGPLAAKRSVVEMVTKSTEAVGGDWTLYRGPDAEVCEQSDGEEGARFVYILERAGADGSAPETDIATVEELWKSKGITTERFASGGADPLTGIRGVGGPVTSVGFNAYPQRYSVTGVSKCSSGNVKDLRQPE